MYHPDTKVCLAGWLEPETGHGHALPRIPKDTPALDPVFCFYFILFFFSFLDGPCLSQTLFSRNGVRTHARCFRRCSIFTLSFFCFTQIGVLITGTLEKAPGLLKTSCLQLPGIIQVVTVASRNHQKRRTAEVPLRHSKQHKLSCRLFKVLISFTLFILLRLW